MVLLRSKVQEWVLPAPLTVEGDAWVTPVGDSPARVVVSGSASVGVLGLLLGRFVLQGVAGVAVAGEAQSLPRLSGSATVSIDATGSTTKNFAIRDALSVAGVTATCLVSVVGSGQIGIVMVPGSDAFAPQIGSAEIELEYYGDGDTPIFPFSLPILFLPIDFSNLDAAAFLDFAGASEVLVGGFGDSEFGITGDAALTFYGSVPVFPFQLPTVFEAASARRGEAEFQVVDASAVVVPVDGSAAAGIVSAAVSARAALFPVRFPFVLQQIVGGASVVLVSDSGTVVSVSGVAAVDVYTVASVN